MDIRDKYGCDSATDSSASSFIPAPMHLLPNPDELRRGRRLVINTYPQIENRNNRLFISLRNIRICIKRRRSSHPLMGSSNPVKATSNSSKSKEKEADLGLGNFGLAMGR
jgi:hypothetical protein